MFVLDIRTSKNSNERNFVHFCLLCIIILSLFSRRALLSLLLLSKSLCSSPSNMAYAKIRFKAFSSKLTLRCKIVSHQICRAACLRRSGILHAILSVRSPKTLCSCPHPNRSTTLKNSQIIHVVLQRRNLLKAVIIQPYADFRWNRMPSRLSLTVETRTFEGKVPSDDSPPFKYTW